MVVSRLRLALALLPLWIAFHAAPALAQDCTGVAPWINEFDYDDNTGTLDDRDEFVEIAAPAGTDLSGYRILAVEGNPSLAFPICGTGLGGVTEGNAYFDSAIPGGTVVGDDTGTGVGFLVVCFQDTSTNLAADCDVVLPGVATDSNLKNGNLTNANPSNCPDGVLLLEPGGGLADAISWEGIVPNQGTYGAFFNAPNPSYNVGTDTSFSLGNSFVKVTDVGRAVAASEWLLSGAGSRTPGVENPGQMLACAPPPDADMDGVPDATDNCPLDFNDLQEDVDLDGVGDACDNCPDDFNPGQEDADMDGEGDACECDPNPGPGFWEIEYDLAGSTLDVRNTPGGLGDQLNVVGPGTMTVRYEADGLMELGNVLDGGTAEVVQYELTQFFVIDSGFVTVTTDLVSDIPDDRWNGNPLGVVDPGSNFGTLSGDVTSFVTSLADYHTQGTILCVGSFCGQAGLPNGTPVVVDELEVLDLLSLDYLPGGPIAGQGFSTAEIQIADDPNQQSFLVLMGAELSRTFVPGEPGQVCETDTDGDGFPDDEDNCPAIANDQSDVNGDGIGDVCQPNDPDGDGWPDAEDNCPNDFNPSQSDLNMNGFGDACEPGDGDGDGLPPGEDNCPDDPNPGQEDGDTDGVGDACDNCPADANADQSDLNGDGIGDVCQPNDGDADGWPDAEDNCPADANPGQGDGDTDGVGDACDNCPADANADQNDVNGDGVGDVCQPDDPDGDGWPSSQDNCPADANADQADADSDTVGNVCDNCVNAPNPGQEDADMDGVGDVCEDAPVAAVPALPPVGLWLAAGLIVASSRGLRTRLRERAGDPPHSEV